MCGANGRLGDERKIVTIGFVHIVFLCVRSMIIAPKCHKINAMVLIYWLNLTSLWYRTIYNEQNAHTQQQRRRRQQHSVTVCVYSHAVLYEGGNECARPHRMAYSVTSSIIVLALTAISINKFPSLKIIITHVAKIKTATDQCENGREWLGSTQKAAKRHTHTASRTRRYYCSYFCIP